MRNSEFLHRQAGICIALSRSTFDLAVAGRLRSMAAEFRAQAAEADDEPAPGSFATPEPVVQLKRRQ